MSKQKKKKDKDKGKGGGKGGDDRAVPPSMRQYRQAIKKLDDGDLVKACRAFLKIIDEHPESEEAYFSETQLVRLQKLYPEEMKEANFDAEAFAAIRKTRAEPPKLETLDKVLVGFVFVAVAWMALLTFAPGAAFIGKGPDVPLIFRFVALVGASLGGYIAYGFLRRKWESVTFFILWIPPLLILTFIGVVESFKSPTDALAGLLCVIALAAEVGAAWYVSKFSSRFVY